MLKRFIESSRKMNEKKKTLGQFYTTQSVNILTGFFLPSDVTRIIEPFVGKGDLIPFIETRGLHTTIELYDIDPKDSLLLIHKEVIRRDTLRYPPNYTDAFVVTNPPYLYRSKSRDKSYYQLYQTDDLYKCFLKSLLCGQGPRGGILILPLNFFSSIKRSDGELRREFLTRFHIRRLNIFEEQVFSDTASAVCSFSFERSEQRLMKQEIETYFYPTETREVFVVKEKYDFLIGGKIYHLKTSPHLKISRLMEGQQPNTNLKLIALDDGRVSGSRIRLEYTLKHYYGKPTSRSYASLLIEPTISEERQKILVQQFNEFIERYRTKYHSLFLPNYRECKDYPRKRIPFTLAYSILNHLLSHESEKVPLSFDNGTRNLITPSLLEK